MLSFNDTMAQLRMEVRDSAGTPLPGYGDAFFDLRLPGDHSRVAQTMLRMIRADDPGSAAHTVRFLRDGVEIGSWSLDHERVEAAFAVDRGHSSPAAA
ncbi:MAG: hypothetical protein WA418_34720 [Bradyrhizobium sp.]